MERACPIEHTLVQSAFFQRLELHDRSRYSVAPESGCRPAALGGSWQLSTTAGQDVQGNQACEARTHLSPNVRLVDIWFRCGDVGDNPKGARCGISAQTQRA